MRAGLLLSAVGLVISATAVRAAVITVTPADNLATIVASASSGDVIELVPGTYTNQFAVVSVPLTIEAVPGSAAGSVVIDDTGFTNDQGIIETFAPLTVNGLTITGAMAANDGTNSSAAAIRDHNNGGGNLIVENSVIKNSQNGIQTGSASGTVHQENVTISNDQFVGDGGPIGPAHALYIGDAATADIINSTFCGTVDGHDIKSRALSTTVTGSTMYIAATGTAGFGCSTVGSASAGIDLPNGGIGVIKNDMIIQGTGNQNGALMIYGGESPFTFASLDVSGTTFTGDGVSSSIGVNVIGGCPQVPLVTGTATAKFQNLGTNVTPGCIAATVPTPPTPATEPRALVLLLTALFLTGVTRLSNRMKGVPQQSA